MYKRSFVAIALVALLVACGSSTSTVTPVDDAMDASSSSPAITDGAAIDAADSSAVFDAGDGGMCTAQLANLMTALQATTCGQCVIEQCFAFEQLCAQDCSCVAAFTTLFQCFSIQGDMALCGQGLSGVPAAYQTGAIQCDFACEPACDSSYVGLDASQPIDSSIDDAASDAPVEASSDASLD